MSVYMRADHMRDLLNRTREAGGHEGTLDRLWAELELNHLPDAARLPLHEIVDVFYEREAAGGHRPTLRGIVDAMMAGRLV